MSLPRVVPDPLCAEHWYSPLLGKRTYVVVPVEAVVTRDCDECGCFCDAEVFEAEGTAGHGEKYHPCPTCHGTGQLEAVLYDPHGILGQKVWWCGQHMEARSYGSPLCGDHMGDGWGCGPVLLVKEETS